VGTILERLQKRSWEELIQEQLFAPLALAGAGLGPQSSLGLTDAPLGHLREGGKLRPMLAGPNADNPLVIGPAGVAHMSLLGAARWAGWNAAQGRRGPALVSAASLQRLHTAVIATDPDQPAGDRYALGWLLVQPPWASGTLLMHAGSNTRNLAHLWVDPVRDLALVLLTNVAGPKADEALSELAPLLNRQFAAPAAMPPD
jgi:CubicO group peptidase (beta-lactamase class C family)